MAQITEREYTLARQFDVAAPDKAWVTDITYIRTLEPAIYVVSFVELTNARERSFRT